MSVERSAPDLQPSVYEGQAVNKPVSSSPGLMAQRYSVVAVPLCATEEGPTDVVSREIQDASIDQEMFSLQALRPLLAATIGVQVEKFNSCR
ncbi:hypothetical protein KCU70_g10374, partial [Aureobasidium melanogenum]